MKKLLLIFCTLMTSIVLYAQTPLPYYTSFNHGSEGWTSFNKGNTANYAWELVNIRISPPDDIGLRHPSLEFATAGDTSINWYVSPAFLFPNGGKIDSFAANIYLWGGAMDSIDVYVLIGSNDPDLATSKIKLANLMDMKTNANFDVRDTGNFAIPATTDSTYIAFRFTAVATDWYEVRIDDLHISGNPGAGVNTVNNTFSASIYPNPASNELHISLDKPVDNPVVTITNAIGQVVQTKHFHSAQQKLQMNTAMLPAGIYFLQVNTNTRAGKPQRISIVR